MDLCIRLLMPVGQHMSTYLTSIGNAGSVLGECLLVLACAARGLPHPARCLGL